MRRTALVLAVLALLVGCTTTSPRVDLNALERQVADTERAFAKTMADRDFEAFQSFLSEETVFFSASGALRGKAAVAERWERLYESPQAPFSWEPKEVEVLPSGELALTSGPVFDPSGKEVGTFTSIWRLEAPGTWRIIFDKGCDACECPEKKG